MDDASEWTRRDIDDVPLLGWMSRLSGPKPDLQPNERMVFSTVVYRAALTTPWYWYLPLSNRGRESSGRLTLTEKRLIYKTRRDPDTLFLAKYPKAVGNVKFELARIVAIDYRSRWYRALWQLSAMPGMAVVEILLDNGELFRFHSVPRKWWDEAIEELTTIRPNLRTALEFKVK